MAVWDSHGWNMECIGLLRIPHRHVQSRSVTIPASRACRTYHWPLAEGVVESGTGHLCRNVLCRTRHLAAHTVSNSAIVQIAAIRTVPESAECAPLGLYSLWSESCRVHGGIVTSFAKIPLMMARRPSLYDYESRAVVRASERSRNISICKSVEEQLTHDRYEISEVSA